MDPPRRRSTTARDGHAGARRPRAATRPTPRRATRSRSASRGRASSSRGRRSTTSFVEFLTLPALRATAATEGAHHDDDRDRTRRTQLERRCARPALGRHRRAPTRRRTSSGCAARSHIEHTLARLRRGAAVGAAARRAVRPRARRAHRQPGRADGRAGLEAIYLSGWQVAADANLAGADVPGPEPLPGRTACPRWCGGSTTRSCAPTRSTTAEGERRPHWFAPIVADAEAGFGGPLNAFELMKAMIEAGAAGVHFEDQLASEKKCGHMGGKVLVPTSQFVRTLIAARLAADVLRRARPSSSRAPTRSAPSCSPATSTSATSRFLTGERTAEGFFRVRERPRLRHRPRPRLRAVRRPASGARRRRPTSARPASSPRRSTRSSPASCSRTTARPRSTGRSTSTTRRSRSSSASSRDGLPVPVRHAGRLPRAQLRHVRARARVRGRGDGGLRRAAGAGVRSSRRPGYTATRHQREVGTGYFDLVASAVSQGTSSTLALEGSTESAQFRH